MKSINALFVAGLVLCLVGGGGGALILLMSYGHDEVTQPMWKMGQYWMFQGLLNLAVYTSLYLLIRRNLQPKPRCKRESEETGAEQKTGDHS